MDYPYEPGGVLYIILDFQTKLFSFKHRTLDSRDVLLRGQMTVPMQLVDKIVPYKYCLFTNGILHYEEVIEFKTAWSGIVNRCLLIPKQFSKQNGKVSNVSFNVPTFLNWSILLAVFL